jgi:flagellar hook assembly protein FlgD
MFDVRFGSGRIAEQISEKTQVIEMSGIEFPVRIKAENIGIRVQDETGKVVNERLNSGQEIIISSNAIQKLIVSENIIPDKYSLEQNYPNPFNPTTIIGFSIPEDAKNVRLTIYNSLGERVAELVNGSFEAGVYQYHWNATGYASGLYIYELRTSKFVSIKKMLLMK